MYLELKVTGQVNEYHKFDFYTLNLVEEQVVVEQCLALIPSKSMFYVLSWWGIRRDASSAK